MSRVVVPMVEWTRRHPTAADTLLALLVLALTVPSLFVTSLRLDVAFREPDALGVVLVVLANAPIAWRRRAATGALLTSTVAEFGLVAFNYSGGSGLGVLVCLYTVAAHCPRQRSVRLFVVVVLAIVASLLLNPQPLTLDSWLFSLVVFVTAWVLGDNLGTRRAYVAELEDRAQRLERERDLVEASAVATERRRIARELHDVVAHHVSVMVVQAAAARRTLPRDPARADAVLASSETTGRQALGELRRLLGFLRPAEELGAGGSDDREPQPGVDQVAALVDQVRDAGLPVELRITGEPRPLPPGVDLSAYRIVQEALTNALKHAGPARARVELCYGHTDFEVRVQDDGRGVATRRSADANGLPGHGLLGMRERVALFDGELRVGPEPGGGFRVHARLPVEPVPA